MSDGHSAAREVRRMLLGTVRSDWSFGKREKVHEAGNDEHPPHTYKPISQQAKVIGWRERYYGSSMSSSPDATSASEMEGHDTSESDNDLMALSDMSEEKSPARRTSRKRKRKRLVQEEDELQWNEGLALWTARRNAWTGAVICPAEAHNSALRSEDKDSDSTYQSQKPHLPSVDKRHSGSSYCSSSSRCSCTHSAAQSQPDTTTTTITTTDHRFLIPIPEPLIPPANAVRLNITPAAYTEIYNKFVVSARSPSIPINLADMVAAMVKGWRDAGEWPPKGSILATNTAGTETTLARSAVGKRKEMAVIRSIAAAGGKHGHLKKGVESVRRAFGLGHGHHVDG